MKRLTKALILVVVLGAAVAAYFIATNIGKKDTAVTQDEGTFQLTDAAIDSVTGIKWTKDGTEFSFVRDSAEGEWKLESDETFPVDQDEVTSLVEDTLALTGTRKYEGVTTLSEYGFTDDSFTVTLTTADGAVALTCGGETPFADGYYVKKADDGVVYVAKSDPSSLFTAALNDFAVLETIPTGDTVTRVTVGDTFDIEYLDESTTLDKDQHWYDAATGNALVTSSCESAVSSVKAITWSGLVTAQANSQELMIYGLAETATSVTLKNGDETVTEILFGSTDADGNVYARLPASAMVYTVSASTASAVLNLSTSSMQEMTLIPVAEGDFASVTLGIGTSVWEIGWETKEVTVEATASPDATASSEEASTEETSDEETDVTTQTVTVVTVNGVEVDTASGITTILTGIEAASFTDEAATGAEIIRVTVRNASGVEKTFVFCEYSADQYMCDTGDGRTALVSADNIDKLVRTAKQLG